MWIERVVAITLAGACHLAFANELKTTIGVDAEYSDNSQLLPKGQEVSDTMITPGIDVDYVLDYASFDAQLTYGATREHYTQETFDDRTWIVGEGTFTWNMVDQHLYWDFYQNSNRLMINSVEPDTPDNQTKRHIFVTGPRLRINPDSKKHIDVSANYVSTTFDATTIVDTEQAVGRLVFVNQFSRITSYRIKLEYRDSDCDIQSFCDYTRKRAGIGFTRGTQRWQYSGEAGRNIIDRRFEQRVTGTYGEISARYQTSTFKMDFSATRDVTDSALGLSLNESLSNALDTGDTNFEQTDIVKRTRFEAGFSWFNNVRSQVHLLLFHDTGDYQTIEEKEITTGGEISLDMGLSPLWSGTLAYRATNDRLETGVPNQSQRNNRYRMRFRYTPNPRVALTFWLIKQTGSFRLHNSDYTELLGGLGISWQI